jgi:sortase A
MRNNPIAKILIIGAILLASFAIWRGFYYAPNDKTDAGIAVVRPQTDSQNEQRIPTDAELPSRLIIPKLNIDAHVQRLGVTSSGNMAAPNNFTDISWYKHGTVPGFRGSAVMAGHVDNALGRPAVFYELPQLEVGDSVYVVRENGERLHYQVIGKELYPWNDSPVERIFNDSSGTYLNLITCQGDWVAEARSAENRLVIYTRLVE